MTNNEFAIESFISFCDDMIIAEEGFKEIKEKAWQGIKNIWAKIVTWFKNILLNVNRFKNATLDSTQNSDMVKILKMSQVGTEKYFSLLNTYYKVSNILTKSDDGHMIEKNTMGEANEPSLFTPNTFTTIEDQARKIATEIRNALDGTKDSKEYKRFIENSYSNKDTKVIPLNNIVSELQLCNKMCTKFQGELSKIENCNKKVLNAKKGEKLVSLIQSFLNHVVQYYTFRIEILTKFFTNAKASLKGTFNNIKEAVGDRQSIRNNRSWNLIYTTIRVILGDKYEETKKLYNDALEAETYESYLPIYKKLVSNLKCSGRVIEKCEFNDTTKICTLMLVKDNPSKIPISPSQKLFHSDDTRYNLGLHIQIGDPNIKELEPQWKTKSGTLFPEPRVYFHLNVPRNRYSGSKNMGVVFVAKNNPSEVYVDKEMGHTAVFVKTTKPIPVEKVDLEEFNKTMDIKLGLSK